ncbi:L-type lectin-like domain-containing protein [Meloidogyne graminicola]|uniref:L-type lectin-like domain-containing protein n=1 Tax=Meloidogyne graminicola TaxID=189291 RepID=A0A8S9ZWV1_9BILA|nr:L-type lectin-like domain-containing protein [Meloidogyne graminicola]
MSLQIIVIFLFNISFLFAQLEQPQQLRRFEYKHSFRTPNLAQRDGTIPFWTVAGDAIASGEQLRLAPSMRSMKGLAWNKRQFVASDHFEIEVAFKVTGQGRIGADGLAIWYTAQQGTLGPVFGANDYWTGMGIMLDSFDNDGAKNNPSISLMINDGTRSFDHHTDGSSQVLGSCHKDFRNKQFPIHLKAIYFRNVLTILISDGIVPTPRYELCIRVENVFLPKAGFFGVSAATGGLADDHDILDFSTFSIFTDAAQMEHAKQQLAQEEKTRAEAEFERQQAEFEKEREKYKEQHPEKARAAEHDEASQYYEDAQMRELRQIYEAQSQIYKVLQTMEQRLQDIAKQQTIHTNLLQGGAAISQGGQQQQAAAGGGFLLHEKNELIQVVRELSASLRDMKHYVNEIYTRTYNVEQKIQHGIPPASGTATVMQLDQATRNYLEQMQAEIRQIRASQVSQVQHPPPVQPAPVIDCPMNCISTTIFLSIVALQSVALFIFIFIRSKSDKAKFY